MNLKTDGPYQKKKVYYRLKTYLDKEEKRPEMEAKAKDQTPNTNHPHSHLDIFVHPIAFSLLLNR
jgi:hypothetical protein